MTSRRTAAATTWRSQPDGATLPQDPRELLSGENLNNPNYVAYYNDPFEICETDVLFETQARQNALLGGDKPVYTAKPRPKTCGEWRAAVERGRQYIVTNPITGAALTPQTLINVATYLGYDIPDNRDEANALLAAVVQQRYGWPDVLLTPLKVVADYLSPPGSDAVAERAVYNTHAYSKGNQGHEYTKVLTDDERRAIIEYLKTL